MSLPENGRVIIIDDKISEVELLLKVLSQQRVAFNYFSGKIEELPSEPFPDVRIVFLDLFLEGITSKDIKTAKSTLLGVLGKIIDKNIGPFILVLWTKHSDYKDDFENELKKQGYYSIVVNAEKSKFFNTDGSLKEPDLLKTYNNIREMIEKKLSNLGAYELFILWENIIHTSASITVNELSRFITFDENWNEEMLRIFHNLAKAWAGKVLEEGNHRDILQSSFFTFNGILLDMIEKEIQNISDSPVKSFGNETISREIIAKINSSLLFDSSPKQQIYPGNVYITEIFENFIKDILNENDEVKLRAIEESSINIIVEVSPLCDFVQKKLKKYRFVQGVMLPGTIEYNGNTLNNIWKKIKRKTLYLYISPEFDFEEKKYKFILDFRYFSSADASELNGKELVFRLRKEILTDIQTSLSSHVSRAGVLFLE